MAAPEFVPLQPLTDARVYTSPPRRPDSWAADRPGDLEAGQPQGRKLGSPGPDQGYALKLANRFRGKLHLQAGEHEQDAIVGCLGVALKRASSYGRAPVIFDLTLAFHVFGFLNTNPPAELVALRRSLFDQVSHVIHYDEQRLIADLVPEATLRKRPEDVARVAAADWKANLDPEVLAQVLAPAH